MNDYKLTVGLEVHAELATKSKMFCGCINNPDEEVPNTNICPICMAHPGTLPTLNAAAIKKVVQVGVAIGGNIASQYTEWDRKNYFYPDIPKNYQISQFAYPLVTGGQIAGVDITRIHLEEDTAQSQHEDDRTLINYNRAGVPLMELVTEPVIHDAETAATFARELQLLLRTLGAGEANMEKGEMRVEANISVSKTGELGTKVEVKNLNSIKAVQNAIAYEFDRHVAILEGVSQDELVQETRGWDEQKSQTFSQRKKETSADYRYFPDPDLPKLCLDDMTGFTVPEIKATLPELPDERRARYVEYNLSPNNAETLVQDAWLGNFYDEAYNLLGDKSQAALLSNYITSDLVALHREHVIEGELLQGHATPQQLADMVMLIADNKLSSRGAKDLLADLFVCEPTRGERKAEEVAKEKGFLQVSDMAAIEQIVKQILVEHKDVADEVRGGKEAAMGFLVGQGMKASKGAANPQLLRETILKLL